MYNYSELCMFDFETAKKAYVTLPTFKHSMDILTKEGFRWTELPISILYVIYDLCRTNENLNNVYLSHLIDGYIRGD